MMRARVSIWIGAATMLVAVLFAVRCSSGPDTSATTELIAALKQKSLPGMPDPLTPEKALEIDKWRTGPGGWFVQKGCFACHDVSVYGIKSATAMGPDLAQAVDDVKSRFGMSLEEFLKQPVGTMTVVLSQMIVLSPEEKVIALEKLREANRVFTSQKKSN